VRGLGVLGGQNLEDFLFLLLLGEVLLVVLGQVGVVVEEIFLVMDLVVVVVLFDALSLSHVSLVDSLWWHCKVV
jgi:hypothetical protein